MASFFPHLADEIDADEYRAEEASLETQLPVIKHMVHESEQRGVDPELPRFTERLIEQAIADGYYADSYSRVVEHFRPKP